jgi:hypothetical protein
MGNSSSSFPGYFPISPEYSSSNSGAVGESSLTEGVVLKRESGPVLTQGFATLGTLPLPARQYIE